MIMTPRLLLVVCALLSAPLLHAATGEGNDPVAKLPEFELADPTGAKHTQKELLERGAVVIVTIPNLEHGEKQERWARYLTRNGWDKNGPALVLLEDVSQMKSHRETADAKLKEKFEPGKNPLILIDSAGTVRKAFGIREAQTVIFIIGKDGAVVYYEENPPEIDLAKEVLKRAKQVK